MEQKSYLYVSKKGIMDLSRRKYEFIQELIALDKERIMDALERVLKREKEALGEISLADKQELDSRLAGYHEHPEDVLDWEDIKENW